MGSAKKRLIYTYDSRGNRRSLVDSDGGRFTYSYDATNRITRVLNPQGERTSYSYDAGGRRTLKRMANGTRASFTYDAASNLTALCNLRDNGTVISGLDYSYDKVGNRTRVVEADGSRVTWSYDATYQLTGEHRTFGTADKAWATLAVNDWDTLTVDEWNGLQAGISYQDTYTYDPAGNRLLKIHDGVRTSSSYDAANQLQWTQDASGRTTYTFDADGNQHMIREPSGNRTTYSWDYENRMTRAQLPNGSRSTMAYEPDGLRVKLEEPGETKKFVWDDQNYLAETDGANDTQMVYTNEPGIYGRLISQRRGSTTSWYHFDAIGSTRQLTSSAPAVTDTRLFDTWGAQLASSGSTIFPFGYVGVDGYYTDVADTRLYVRARHYRPILGAWLSVDPIWPSPREQRYVYVGSRPQTFSDPSGRERISFEFNAFIPKRLGRWLPEPFSFWWEFKGDNRGPGERGTSRMSSFGFIDSCNIGLGNPVGYNRCGASHRRYCALESTINGRRECINYVEEQATALLQIDTVSAGHRNPCFSGVLFIASASYAFISVWISPEIDYDVAFYFTAGADSVTLEVGGSHESFPDYEAIVDGKVIYHYATTYSGPNPWNLGGHPEVSWRRVVTLDKGTRCVCGGTCDCQRCPYL